MNKKVIKLWEIVKKKDKKNWKCTIGNGTQVLPPSNFRLKKLRLCPICLIIKNLLLSYQLRQLRMSRTSSFCKNTYHVPVHITVKWYKLRPCETGKFPLRLIEMITEILMIIMKRFIKIIIVSFVNCSTVRINDYNKWKWKKMISFNFY